MRSHGNDDTPRGIIFTGATGSFHPGLSHCTVWNSPFHPPQPHITAPPAPLLPCSAGPFGITWENKYVVSSFAHFTPTASRLLPYRRPWLLGQLGLFLAKSLHWQGHLSTAAKLAFYLLALTLLPLLPLLRVNGKQNVCVFQEFSSAPFFPLPFGTMLLIAPNRPDHLTTTIPHSKCMTHSRLFLLLTAYHKR